MLFKNNKRSFRFLKKNFLLILSLLPILLTACGEDEKNPPLPAPSDEFYVCDEADILKDSTKEYIIEKNENLHALAGAQVVVACLDSTGDSDIRSYAKELYSAWNIGSADENNGILILLSPEEQEYWCVQGTGLEDTLQNGIIKLMLNNYLEPDFAAGDYDAGVRKIFDALIGHLETIYSIPSEAKPSDTDPSEELPSRESNANIIAWVIIAVIVILLIISFSGRSTARRHHKRSIYAVSPQSARLAARRTNISPPTAARPASYGQPNRPAAAQRPASYNNPNRPAAVQRPASYNNPNRPTAARPTSNNNPNRPAAPYPTSRGSSGRR